MREILFKAQAIKSRVWVEGLLWRKKYNSKTLYIRWFPNQDDEEEVYCVDPETVCQYTGLTDKNGQKIWENDIVVRVDRRNGIYIFREQPKMNCKVIWSDRHGFDTVPSCGYFDKNNALECEVIGNIFDNPELLKGGE